MKNENATYEDVKNMFNSDKDEHDKETAELLTKAANIFLAYREKANTQEFMIPDKIQKMIRHLTSIVAILNIRLGYYDNEEITTYWCKNIIRVTKRNELYKNKTKNKLTDKLIENISDSDEDYKSSIREHLKASDFANKLKLTVQSAKIMLRSLEGEQIRLQTEKKYSKYQK